MICICEYATSIERIACIFINYFCEQRLIIVPKEVLRNWLKDMSPHANKTYQIQMLNVSMVPTGEHPWATYQKPSKHNLK